MNRIRLREAAELGETVEGQEVGVVSVVGTARVIVKSGAAGGDDVLAVEQPVHVLEAVSRDVRMMEQDATHLPIQQVGRGGEGEGVADGARLARPIAVLDNAGQSPVAFGLGVKADGELLGAVRNTL